MRPETELSTAPVMTRASSGKNRRRRILIDRGIQLSVVLHVVGSLAVLTLVYVAAVALAGVHDVAEGSDAPARLAVIVAGLYFVLATAAAVTVGIVATHRIAGPVHVIEHVIRGLRERDYGRRIALRKRDQLQSLAAEVAALRDELGREETARRRFHEQMEAALADADHDEARRLNRAHLAILQETLRELREASRLAPQERPHADVC